MLALDHETPHGSFVTHLLYALHFCLKSDTAHDAVLFGKCGEIFVYRIAGDISVWRKAFLFHGKAGVFKETVADLREQIRVDVFVIPNTTNTFAIV